MRFRFEMTVEFVCLLVFDCFQFHVDSFSLFFRRFNALIFLFNAMRFITTGSLLFISIYLRSLKLRSIAEINTVLTVEWTMPNVAIQSNPFEWKNLSQFFSEWYDLYIWIFAQRILHEFSNSKSVSWFMQSIAAPKRLRSNCDENGK